MKTLPSRLLGFPRTAEWFVRTVLLVGFFVLLALVAILGFLGWRSFQDLSEQIGVIRQSEVNHARVVGQISETAKKIQAQALTVRATSDSKYISFPARQTLKESKDEMDDRIKDGYLTSL